MSGKRVPRPKKTDKSLPKKARSGGGKFNKTAAGGSAKGFGKGRKTASKSKKK